MTAKGIMRRAASVIWDEDKMKAEATLLRAASAYSIFYDGWLDAGESPLFS